MRPPAVPRLWTTFALAWLLALVITVALLLGQPMTIASRMATLADLAFTGCLYLYLALRAPPQPDAGGEHLAAELRANLSPIAGVAALALLVLPLIALVPSGGMWWNVIYAVVTAGLLLPPRLAGVAVGTLVALAMLTSRIVAGIVEPRLLIQLAIGGAAMAVRALTVTIEELRLAREELALRAVDAERLRIARDLHDLLGHSLSLLALKSELASRLLPTSPDAAARELRDMERAARHALREVRDVVTEYRRPALRSEIAAASELLAASDIRLSLHDEAGELTPAADMLFAWTVREAVTNVIRHSNARECRIHTIRTPHGYGFTVADNGVGASSAARHGSGLMGIRERCDAVNARFDVTIDDTGFTVSVTIPHYPE